MFCPDCRAEYEPGFTRCSDCDVELVEELPTKAPHREVPSSRLPEPPDVSAFMPSADSSGWLARHALAVFLVVPVLADTVVALTGVDIAAAGSVAVGLVSLLACWAVGTRQEERPARMGLRVIVFAVTSVAYAAAVLVPLYSLGSMGLGDLALPYLPLFLTAGLLAQASLSPNAGLRRLVRPLLCWRAPWRVYAVALFALPLVTVLVVWVSRQMLQAAAGTVVEGSSMAAVLSLGWVDALLMGPWALAWFGYGVPMLLRRRSPLFCALVMGVLTWLSQGIAALVFGVELLPDASLNLVSGIAVAVLAVWLFQRARGSVWPVLVLEGTTAVVLLTSWAADGFDDSTARIAVVVAEAALAVVFVVVGRMWSAEAP